MADAISKDLMIEDMGRQQGEAESKRDGKNSKPDNKYCRGITEVEANRLIREASGQKAANYDTMVRDIEQAWADYKRENLNYDKLLKDEQEIEAYHDRYKNLVNKANSGGVLNPEETNVVNNMNTLRFEAWLGRVRESRMASQKLKTSLRSVKDTLTKEAATIRAECGTTLVWQQNGKWYTKYAQAPDDSGQSNKRQKETVAREYVEMLTTPEGLQHLDFDAAIELVKEYRDVFPYEHQQNKVLSLAVQKIEKQRSYVSRKTFAEYCYETFEQEIQWDFNQNIKNMMLNKDQKYELTLPACRGERIKQLQKDGKDYHSVRDKNIARENRRNSEYRKHKGVGNRTNNRGGQNSQYNNSYTRPRNNGQWPRAKPTQRTNTRWGNSNWGNSGSRTNNSSYNQGYNNSYRGRASSRGASRGRGRGQSRGRGGFRGRGSFTGRGRY